MVRSNFVSKVISYFMANVKFDNRSVESVTKEFDAIRFISLHIFLVIAAIIIFTTKIFLMHSFSLFFYLTPIIVGMFSLIGLFAVRKFGTIEPYNSLYLLSITIYYTVTFLSEPPKFYTTLQFVFIILVFHFLKGRVWGTVVSLYLMIVSFIIYKTTLLFAPDTTHFYFIVVAIMIVSIIPYINDVIQSRMLIRLVHAEKENLSRKIIKRLLHEILNPLNIAGGYTELIINEGDYKPEDVVIINEQLEAIERVVRKMGQYCDNDTLSTLIENSESEIKIEPLLKV